MRRPLSEIADKEIVKPYCGNLQGMKGKETAMDFVDGINQRELLPNYRVARFFKRVSTSQKGNNFTVNLLDWL